MIGHCVHELKGCVLFGVLSAPPQCIRISFTNALSDFFADDWYAAQPAMIAVALEQRGFLRWRRHPLFRVASINGVRRRVSDGAKLHVRTLSSPKRLCVVAEQRHIRKADEPLRDVPAGHEVRGDRCIEKACRIRYLWYRLPQVLAIDCEWLHTPNEN